MRCGILAAALLALPLPAHQGDPSLRYLRLQLDCARYQQQIQSTILLEGPGTPRSRETTGRDGTLVVRASGGDSVLSLEAWFDTLAVWREGGSERLEPETDGVIGGRFRGTLSPHGGFVDRERPFVPDDIAQVADVGDALAELFPPLPPVRLAPGGAWRDGFGLVILRAPDGSRGGRRVERYRINRRLDRDEARLLPDSSEVRAHRSETESSVLEWSEEVGPVRWEREITVDVAVPASGPVKRPFRTRITQIATIARVPGDCTPP